MYLNYQRKPFEIYLLILIFIKFLIFQKITSTQRIQLLQKQYLNVIDKSKKKYDISADYIKWSEIQRLNLLENRSTTNRKSIDKSTDRFSNMLQFTTNPISFNLDLQTTFTNKNNNDAAIQNDNNSNNLKITFYTTTTTTTTTTNSDITTLIHSNDYTFNQTTENEIHTVVYSRSASVILAILTAIVSFITVVGNILVLLSFIVERALRTASNYFLASLAVTDVLIGIFSMNFYTLYLLLGYWPLGRLSCDLWLSLDYTACLTSQYTVLIITIDRFCSVHLPAKYRNWRTDRKILLLVAVTWFVPSSVFFVTIMGWPYFHTTVKPRLSNQCYAEFSNDPIFNTVFTVCYFWVTLCVMIGLYVGIYRVAVDLQKRSDEKRNRVSGLITMNKNNDSNVNNLNSSNNKNNNTNRSINFENHNRKLDRLKNQQNSHNLQHSSSICGLEDSSGFDSNDDKTKFNKPINDKNNVNKYQTNQFSNNLNQDLNKTNDVQQLSRTSVTTIRPTQNIQARCDIQDLNMDFLFSKLKQKPDVDFNENDLNINIPSSVKLIQNKGLIINSPILTDEELLTTNIIDIKNCINSPSLEDLSSENEEINSTNLKINSQTLIKTTTTSTTITTTTTTNVITTTKSTATKLMTIASETNTNKINKSDSISDNDLNTSNIPIDKDYQNRVLEQFKQRLAAMNLKYPDKCNSKFISSDVNEQSKDNFSNKQLCNGKLDYVTSTDIDNINENSTVNESKQIYKSNCLLNSSPIWKSRVHNGTDSILSEPCSLRSYNCSGNIGNNNNNAVINDEYISRQECLLCQQQRHSNQRHHNQHPQDSDTLQSSSTYGDYTGSIIYDQKCLCDMNKNYENKLNYNFYIKYKFEQFIMKFKQYNNLSEKLKNSLQIKKSKQKMNIQPERGRRENRARKALRTITLILGAFVLCWTPYHVVIIIKGICDNIEENYTCVNEIFYSITYWLCYINSPINPFCYALANAQFKKTFLRLFHGDFKRT